MKKKNFQYECAIKLQQHVLNKGVHWIQKEMVLFVPQLCFELDGILVDFYIRKFIEY
jgi:hypothetical protein